VVPGQVRSEGVVAEVGFGVTPDRVGVVGVALGVVVLDEQPRALQPVIQWRAGLGGAGPGQVHGVQRGVVSVAWLRWQAVRDASQVGGQQSAEKVPLPGVQIAGRKALGGAGQREPPPAGGVVAGGLLCGLADPRHLLLQPRFGEMPAPQVAEVKRLVAVGYLGPVAADDFPWRPVQQDRLPGLPGIERADELASQVLGTGQRSQRGGAKQRCGGRVGAQEARGHPADRAVGDQVVQ
jgi:hypothetical protein